MPVPDARPGARLSLPGHSGKIPQHLFVIVRRGNATTHQRQAGADEAETKQTICRLRSECQLGSGEQEGYKVGMEEGWGCQEGVEIRRVARQVLGLPGIAVGVGGGGGVGKGTRDE
ncbi:hypothetical protein DPEC_G00277320 [Dallia pectoralis]|uniref:Uncharacterized protein n=1 Tax=Dallia pectoralis TaxID=75939 RepID=A0ACC2FLX9_DALPE|nr:hypothetical protein DPEC_G00277320 [Dallia pectoralis]